MSGRSCATSATDEAVDPDGDERTGRHGDAVHVGDLAAWIEGGKQEQAAEAPGDRGGDDFEDNEDAATRTTVSVCKVTLAVRTGRHQVLKSRAEQAAQM
jgi:pyruvate/2-oxoglutarate dehydrogenase complex dihydrolipoamide acyltransferase (E2) component